RSCRWLCTCGPIGGSSAARGVQGPVPESVARTFAPEGFRPICGAYRWRLAFWGSAPWLPSSPVAPASYRFPSCAPITTPAGMPALTAFLLLVMASIVAGVTEEAAFRGYMQSMIERRYGVTLAILVNGTLFGLLFFGNHPRDVLLMLPYYVAVSAVYGGLTWAADSILPALVLHSGGDIVVLTRWWATGRPEWQVAATPPTLVWERGADAP